MFHLSGAWRWRRGALLAWGRGLHMTLNVVNDVVVQCGSVEDSNILLLQAFHEHMFPSAPQDWQLPCGARLWTCCGRLINTIKTCRKILPFQSIPVGKINPNLTTTTSGPHPSSMSSAGPLFRTTNHAGVTNNVNGDFYMLGEDKVDKIYKWLDAPDSSGNFLAAREKHHGQTGTWFIEGEDYLRWKETPDSALWVYGTRESLKHSPHATTYMVSIRRSGVR
ncbi:hypothetical protein FIBSPDRAFT_68888 [Athelia psychrophila]|uniref:Uncharacterized protein n=1 Tax=Athelia psychrophila TaxID=1759441 RepID=A0A166TR49_9AGAM|nr:hypothetical protein FIBSPDRAFT_68888 [Fibularhizoctonia sp. CBS 109695]